MKFNDLTEEDLLSEVKMSPSTLRSMASKITGVKVGIEFELVIKDFGDDGVSTSDMESSPDYEQNEYVNSASMRILRRDILEFFADGEYNSRKEVKKALDKAENDYIKWQQKQWEQYIEDNYEDWHEEKQDEEPDGDWDKPADEKPYLDEFEEDNYNMFESEEGSIENWLDSEDIEMMDTFGSRYGLTWPHWEEDNNPEDAKPIGIGKRDCYDIAESFGEAVGMPVKICKKYHGCGSRPTNAYVMEPDSSITPDREIDWGWEFVGPPMSLDDALDQIEKVRAWAKNGNAYTNESCGLHMNISLPGYNMEKLDFIKLALFLGDEWVSEQFKRLGNKFARSSMESIKNNVAMKPEFIDSAMERLRQGLDSVASKLIHSGHVDKMTSINTKNERIEFRSLGNNWIDMNLSTVMNTLLRMVVAMDIALDPEKEKKEYSTKLYKVLSGDTTDNRLQLFSMYNAGTISREEFLQKWSKLILTHEKPESSTKAVKHAANIVQKLKVFKIIHKDHPHLVYGYVDAFDMKSAMDMVNKNPDKYGVVTDSWDLKEVPYKKSVNLYHIVDVQTDEVYHTFSSDSASSAVKYAMDYSRKNKLPFERWVLQNPHNSK